MNGFISGGRIEINKHFVEMKEGSILRSNREVGVGENKVGS